MRSRGDRLFTVPLFAARSDDFLHQFDNAPAQRFAFDAREHPGDRAARIIHLRGCLGFAIEEVGNLDYPDTAHELRYAALQLAYEAAANQRV